MDIVLFWVIIGTLLVVFSIILCLVIRSNKKRNSELMAKFKVMQARYDDLEAFRKVVALRHTTTNYNKKEQTYNYNICIETRRDKDIFDSFTDLAYKTIYQEDCWFNPVNWR